MLRLSLILIFLLLFISCDDTYHHCNDSSCTLLSGLQAVHPPGGLEPFFRSDSYQYSLFLPRGSDSVCFTAWSNCPYAQIYIDGQLTPSGAPSLDIYFNESVIVEILVLSSSGQEVVYSVEVFELVEE
jgi:hypothetical protein